jgi:type VI secretion system VasD/TssJ family lipoprotein
MPYLSEGMTSYRTIRATMRRFLWLIFPSFLGFGGCVQPPDPLSTESGPSLALVVKVDGNLTTDEAGNLTVRGLGQPVSATLHIYQLADTEAFNRANPVQLFEQGPSALGKAALAYKALEFSPKSHGLFLVGWSTSLEKGARAIGVVASFHDSDHSLARATAPIDSGQTTRLDVLVSDRSIALRQGITPQPPLMPAPDAGLVGPVRN